MAKLFNILLAILTNTLCVFSQSNTSGGGEVNNNLSQCLSQEMHESIVQDIQQKYLMAKEKGILKVSNKTQGLKFIWPVKQQESITDPSIQGVSNFVDHDTTRFTQGINTTLDYECKSKTYDTDTYNHTGTDIYLYPFQWKLMEDEIADVVAAKDGIIIGKYDNNDDMECALCTNCYWNAIYLWHDDNTITIYGHLKKGTLTNLSINSDVKQGDYLGKVGSSGNSTGPHLHFEVQDINGNVIDPFIGDCNSSQLQSLWENQRLHDVPMINALKTSTAPPIFGACPDDVENSFENKTFQPGENIVLTAFLTDQKISTFLNLKIINPLGVQIANFNRPLTQNYNTSYWYWTLQLNLDAVLGEYILRGTYLNQVVDYKFVVNSPTSTLNIKNLDPWLSYNNNEINLDINPDEHVLICDMLGKSMLPIMKNDLNNWSNILPGFYIALLFKKNKIVNSIKLSKW